MRTTGYVEVDEPFTGLFTQGMITHESYKSATGEWLYPEMVQQEPGRQRHV